MFATTNFALFASVFIACAVEAVEAVTIVLAAGTARDWKSAIRGTLAGLLVLIAIIALLGPAISRLPISYLRIFVGGLLLTFGLQWLRKAILRASGFKDLHDEEKIFQEELRAARAATTTSKFAIADWYAFTLSFKGVLLEGLEVVFIVLTFGTIQKQVPLASLAALLAVALAALAGVILAKPLSQVPENQMKFLVGILLTAFGIFWGVEGVGGHWPEGNWTIIILIAAVAAISISFVQFMSKREKSATKIIEASESETNEILEPTRRTFGSAIKAFALFWYDFIIGDDWRVACGIVIAFSATKVLEIKKLAVHQSYLVIPLAVFLLLGYSLQRMVKQSAK